MPDKPVFQLSLFADLGDNAVEDSTNKGVVYFVRSPSTKLIKIGFAEDFGRRQQQYATHTPEKLQWLFVVKTSDYKRLERQLHAQFPEKRRQGEWFALNVKDLVWVWRNIPGCRCVSKKFKRWLRAMRYDSLSPQFVRRFKKARAKLHDPYNDFEVWNLYCTMMFKGVINTSTTNVR